MMENYKKETKQTYDISGEKKEEKFQQNFGLYFKPCAEKFVSLLSGPKILDIGCGPGVYLDFFREKELDALGIDFSDAFIARCNEKGLNVRKMDAEQPLLWPHSFDGIWAHAVLLHFPKEKAPAILQAWARLLKPNGIFNLMVKEGQSEGFEPDEFNSKNQLWFSYFMEEEIRKWLEKDFEIIELKRIESDHGKVFLVFLARKK